MTERDLEEIARLWQAPDAEEERQVARLAQKARRQARLLAYVDYALAVLVVLAMGIGFVLKPAPETAALGIVVLVALLWVNWKRRTLRQMSLTLKAGDRASFIESSVRNVRANLRRVLLSMSILPAFILAGVLLKLSYRHNGHIEHPLEALAGWAVSTRGLIILGILALLMARLVVSRRRLKAELRRLRQLEEEYREEARQEGTGDG